VVRELSVPARAADRGAGRRIWAPAERDLDGSAGAFDGSLEGGWVVAEGAGRICA
jgi:hypothetical protein